MTSPAAPGLQQREARGPQPETDAATGLTAEEARRRLAAHGPNELPRPPRPGWLRRWLDQLREPMSLLLIGAALLSGLWLGETLEAVAILLIVVLNAVIAVVQEGRARRALDALRDLETPTARTRRDGRVRDLPTSELVPGDVVLVEAGDRVPADLHLVETSGLEIDESILTGESLPVSRSAGAPGAEHRALGGTLVVRGVGSGTVEATGPESTLGRIAGQLGEEQPPTPLQRELGRLGRQLGLVAIGLSVGVFGLVLLRTGLDVEGLRSALLTAIALAVAAVPEGLAAVTTVGLALGVRRMARQGAIVRRLPAVEALGSTDVIAIDKTGTLTENRMELAAVRVGGDGDPRALEALDPGTARALAGAVAHTSTASLDPPVGDPLEIALLEAVGAERLGSLAEETELLERIPFDADRRRSTAVVDGPDGVVLHVKGAPEVVLDRCRDALTDDGRLVSLDGAARRRIERTVDAMAGSGARTLAVARRRLAEAPAGAADAENDLTLVAVLGLRDAVRPSAADTVAAIRAAGVHLLMVTGDHPGTAATVAGEVGLAGPDEPVVTGDELDRHGPPDDPLASRVYARVDPEQKLALVEALHEGDHSVAMTGDGVNDAPALHRADIGVALGRTGSDVAREAADLVITDDDLATIRVAIREGRAIYDNIRKVVEYLVAANLSEVAVVVTALLAFPAIGVPLFPLQLLWINLVTDGLPALALGVDPADPALMRRPPRPHGRHLLTPRRLIVLAGRAAVIAAATTATVWVAGVGWARPWPEVRTILFTALVVAQLAYALVARQPDVVDHHDGARVGLWSNRWLLATIAVSAVLQAVVVSWPPAQAVFSTTRLTGGDWLLVAAAGITPTALMLTARRLRAGRGLKRGLSLPSR